MFYIFEQILVIYRVNDPNTTNPNYVIKMESNNELDVLRQIDELLSQINDTQAKDRIISWVLDKHSKDVKKDYKIDEGITKPKDIKKSTKSQKGRKSSNRTKLSLTII